ncbi:MAG: 50S ribosomal protein L9 [Candidatus Dormibacteraceae bacterium]
MLTRDVENVGVAGDVRSVADGFGRNYLIRRHLAVVAGRGVEREANRLRQTAARREAKDRDVAQELAEQIENKTVVVRLKIGEEGRAFGSVTNEDIARALQAQHNVEVDRRRIEMHGTINQLGEHEVNLRLHRDVIAHINLIVTQDR